MPDRMPEDMSDRMPEDLPVRKCINVMVGITRSKVIVVFLATVTTRYCTTVENTHTHPINPPLPSCHLQQPKKNVPQSRFDYTGWKLGP
jgi:hypothetical protein